MSRDVKRNVVLCPLLRVSWNWFIQDPTLGLINSKQNKTKFWESEFTQEFHFWQCAWLGQCWCSDSAKPLLRLNKQLRALSQVFLLKSELFLNFILGERKLFCFPSTGFCFWHFWFQQVSRFYRMYENCFGFSSAIRIRIPIFWWTKWKFPSVTLRPFFISLARCVCARKRCFELYFLITFNIQALREETSDDEWNENMISVISIMSNAEEKWEFKRVWLLNFQNGFATFKKHKLYYVVGVCL